MALKLLSIAATWRCNIRCTICSIWKQPPSEPEFLDLEQFKQALSDPFFDGLEYLNWFGGEPTLWPRLPEAVAWARERFPRAHERAVVTNAWHARPMLERLAAADPDLLVCLSLDGFAPVHDARHGQPGSYDEVLRGILFVRDHFRKRPRLSVTLVPGGARALLSVAEIAEYYDCEVALRPAVRGSYFLGESDVSWTPPQVDDLEAVLGRLPDRAKGNLDFTAAIAGFLRSGVHKPCACKGLTGVVDPDGTFRLCHSHDSPLPIGEVPGRWDGLVRAARESDCFKPECFIDGPYALSYLAPEHAPWLK
jgi:MoaA/NifB/PqqE/SkfB family radical SAM enzyme